VRRAGEQADDGEAGASVVVGVRVSGVAKGFIGV